MHSFHPHKNRSEDFRRGYYEGWRQGFKQPQYDEVVMINNGDQLTPWEKRQAIMESQEFQTWFAERMDHDPVPRDPYAAFMIDKSLKARLKAKPEWAQEPNRTDYLPVDFPPITDQPAPSVTEPAPSTAEAEVTKREMRARSKWLAEKMDVPEVDLHFAMSHGNRARSFYRSGWGRNRYTGQYVRVPGQKPEIVLGVSRYTKGATAANYAALAHEYGHHKALVEVERKEGEEALVAYIKRTHATEGGRIENEKLAWEYADPYMKEHRPSQKWMKRYCLGTYMGTVPGFSKPNLAAPIR